MVLSTYLDRGFRPYRFSELRDLSLFVTCTRSLNWLKFSGGFSLSVAVEELKISGAEVPATVAPAEPSLNDRFCSFDWDSRAQNALLLYIHNIRLSREVDYLNSRDRTACLERNGRSCSDAAVAAVVSVVTAQNCRCEDHQRLPLTLSSSSIGHRCGHCCCHNCWHLRHHCRQLRQIVIHALHQLLGSVSLPRYRRVQLV